MPHVPLTGAFYSHPNHQNSRHRAEPLSWPKKMMIPGSSFEEMITNMYWYIVCYQEPSEFVGSKRKSSKNASRRIPPFGTEFSVFNLKCLESVALDSHLESHSTLGTSLICKFKEGPPGRTWKIGLFSPDINIPHLSKPNLSTTTRQEAPWFQRPHQHWAQNTPRSTHLEPCQRVELGWMFNDSSMPR